MILTVEKELRENATIAICFDDEGLELLISKLVKLRGRADHDHLMTPSWAGNELTEEKLGGDRYELVNHLRLVKR
jgi:hypothetical protein